MNVVYFSRTNYSKGIAETIAKEFGVEALEIEDDKNWKGFIGFFRGGFYASTDRFVEPLYDKDKLSKGDVIVVSPLWAGGPSPTIRAFIRENEKRKIHLVLTNDGSPIEKAFKKCDILFTNIKSKYGITRRFNNEKEVITKIIKDLS